VYIQNVVVGHKPLSKAQYEQFDQQVESSVYDMACLMNNMTVMHFVSDS